MLMQMSTPSSRAVVNELLGLKLNRTSAELSSKFPVVVSIGMILHFCLYPKYFPQLLEPHRQPIHNIQMLNFRFYYVEQRMKFCSQLQFSSCV